MHPATHNSVNSSSDNIKKKNPLTFWDIGVVCIKNKFFFKKTLFLRVLNSERVFRDQKIGVSIELLRGDE